MSDNHDRPNDHEGEPFEGRTYLYIRDHPADTGAEPLPSGLPFWISPDITVIKPDGSRGSEAIANVENQVEVYVNNAGGIEAVDAYVDVFHADPSTAFNPMTATPIGGGPLTIPGYNRRALVLPWTPPASAAGHRCLLARVALFVPPDTYADGTIFDVVGDRHVSQKNLHVVQVSATSDASFSFKIINPLPEGAAFRVNAIELRDQAELAPLQRSIGCSALRIAEQPLQDASLAIGDQRLGIAAPSNQGITAVPGFRGLRDIRGPRDIRGFANLIPRLRTPRELEASFKGNEELDAVITIGPQGAGNGDVHVVQITQTDEQGRLRGGLTILFQYP